MLIGHRCQQQQRRVLLPPPPAAAHVPLLPATLCLLYALNCRKQNEDRYQLELAEGAVDAGVPEVSVQEQEQSRAVLAVSQTCGRCRTAVMKPCPRQQALALWPPLNIPCRPTQRCLTGTVVMQLRSGCRTTF